MLSKVRRLKLLAKLNPAKEATYLVQILEEQIKNLPTAIDYSGAIKDIQQGIVNLESKVIKKFDSLPFDELKKKNLEEIKSVKEKLNILFTKLDTDKQSFASELLQTKIDADTEIKFLSRKLEQLRLDFLKRGGGSMPQKISVEGTVMSTRYADFNLKGSGVTITKADNNTTKQVDITITGSSGGVTSFNTRTGAVTLTSGDVTTALGFTPGQGTVTSVSGTTNRITSTGGTTPVIDISASYIGQSSITTVGTLSAGAVPASLVTAGTFGTGAYTMNTSLTNPLLIGGTAVGSSLTLKSTSGVGTTDFTRFLVGNNGGTEAMRIVDSGFIGINNPTPVNQFDLVEGAAGVMPKGFYEMASFERNADAKLGVYTSSSSFSNGASLIFGNTKVTDTGGLYPGGELQYIPTSSTIEDGSLRYNSTRRDSSGQVVDFISNIIVMKSNGHVGFGKDPFTNFHDIQNNAATSTTAFDNPIVRIASNAANADSSIVFTDNTSFNNYIGAGGGDIYFGPGSSTVTVRFKNNGNNGFGISPTAVVHIKAGTATANTAPLKFTSGTNLSTTEAGAIEYDGSHLYFTATNAGTRYQLDQQGMSNYAHTIFTPTTGGTVNLINKQYNIINPAGAYIKFTQTISTVTYGNGTVVDGITAPTAGGLTVLVYDSGTTSWY